MSPADANPEPVLDAALLAARLAETSVPVPELITTALWLLAHDDTHPHLWLPWADYAHRSCQQLYGPDDYRTIQAARAHAIVLTRHGHHQLAADILQGLLEAYLQQPPHPDNTEVRIALAVALHAAGRCGQAVREISHALNTARHHYEDRPLLAATSTAVYLGMLTACGRHAGAASLRRAARTWLPEPYRPGTEAFGVLSAVHAPDAHEHTGVCATHLGTLLVEPAVPPTPPSSRPRPQQVAENLAHLGVVVNPARQSAPYWRRLDRS
ncbi:hypothetical protein COUCH_11385 [Couchioplanes caeruleus]|uniref:hypothetical protein n=1 Tax=Couchioplanes caeruleus TaxID=56438 RepID=UPI0020C12DA8|nr:hypothetical protein [Couchioplanes caeruleus]UQU66826.1 hypothetical protein COUCH_11385 [Couchioplanes caeruleus]